MLPIRIGIKQKNSQDHMVVKNIASTVLFLVSEVNSDFMSDFDTDRFIMI